MSDSGYSAEHAALYDVVTAPQDREDTPFYVDRAGEADGPVLELACGTGRVYLELLRAGVDADGLDSSAGALDVLRQRASDEGLDPTVWRADMADFAVDREYALVTCPFNAIQELTTLEQQQALLASVHDLVAPGGTFVFDTFVPSFEHICRAWGEWQQRPIEFRGESVEYHTRTRMVDEVSQTYVAEKKAVTGDGDQLFAFEGEATLLPTRELELLAQQSPFDDWHTTGDYTDEPLADGHSAQVWHLEKSPV